jgi:hypothetical protein
MEGAWATRSGDMSRRLTRAKPNGADLAPQVLILKSPTELGIWFGPIAGFQSDGRHGLEHLSINQNNDRPVMAVPNG